MATTTPKIPRPTPPPAERCIANVQSSGNYRHGPVRCKAAAVRDGYCKTHHPDAVKARRKKSQKRWDYESQIRRFGWARESIQSAFLTDATETMTGACVPNRVDVLYEAGKLYARRLERLDELLAAYKADGPQLVDGFRADKWDPAKKPDPTTRKG